MLLAALMPAILLASCAGKIYETHTVWSMDTAITIKIDAKSGEKNELFLNCDRILASLDGVLSRTNAESDISRINSGSGQITISDDTAYVIRKALEISDITGGSFDITVLPYILMWEECGDKNTLPDKEYILSISGLVNYNYISLSGNVLTKLNDGTKIDLGGIGKGYAADRILDYLKNSGVSYGIISFGSNVAVFGEKPDGSDFKIGIKNPSDTSGVVGYVYMKSGVLSVSGDYERYVEINGEKYHHIINPYDGYPASNGLHSVAVVCDSGAVADALSTALFVMGKEKAIELYNSGKIKFEAVFIGDDGVSFTEGLAGKFEPASDKN